MDMKLDNFTLEALREAFDKEWRKKHKGEFCENQVPQVSDDYIVNKALRFYVGTFSKT